MFNAKAHQRSASILGLALACHLCLAVSALADTGQRFIVPFHAGTVEAQTQPGGPGEQVTVRTTNPAGRLLWERIVASGTGFDFRAFAVDHRGNLFLCGFVVQTVTFGAGTSTITVDDSLGFQIGARALVVANLDADGSARWVNTVVWPNWERPAGLALDTAGNAYLIWTYDVPDPCILQTGSQEVTLPRLGGFATAVLARFSPAGELDWLRRIGNAEAGQVAIDQRRLSIVLRGIRWLEQQTEVTLMFETADGLITGPSIAAGSETVTVMYDLKGTLVSVEEPPPPPPDHD